MYAGGLNSARVDVLARNGGIRIKIILFTSAEMLVGRRAELKASVRRLENAALLMLSMIGVLRVDV